MKTMHLAGEDNYNQATLDAYKSFTIDSGPLNAYREQCSAIWWNSQAGDSPGRGSQDKLQILHVLSVKRSLTGKLLLFERQCDAFLHIRQLK